MVNYKYLIIYLIITNILSFLLFAYDKMQAKRGRWRVSEKALFISALIGGSIGSIVGMKMCRHKTKKWYFKFGIPLVLILQVVGVLYSLFKV